MNKLIALILLVLIIIVASSCKAQYQIDEAKILRNVSLDKFISILEADLDTLKVYFKKSEIPKQLITSIENWSGFDFKIARPTRKYNSTDIALKGFLRFKRPWRQLTMIAKSENLVVMTYKHGSRGFHEHLILAEIKNGEILDLWEGHASYEMKSPKEVLYYLKNTDREYFHTNFLEF